MKEETFDVEDCEVIRETEKGLLIKSKDFEGNLEKVGKDELWIPRSQICEGGDITEESEVGDSGSLIITGWLAAEKGLM